MKDQSPEQSGKVFQAARTIFWAFFGVRRRKHGEFDVANLKPAQIVVAGILGGAVFVLVLLAVVRFVVMSHGATN
ncbi:MAG TPA: DUF2970 domain-containing protein [Rhodocyclaceae bacterium]|nr:DUF2970 domain-containing protein [Rhodocyclaceae bacterium]